MLSCHSKIPNMGNLQWYHPWITDNVVLHFLALLLPAYVVRWEGNSFTLLVCSHLGGYPYPIMLCNISQTVPLWADTYRGVWPCQVQLGGGTLPGLQLGGTLPGPAGGVSCQEGYPAGGYPAGGGTQLGQQKEYSLHGGRYASCVHAGGLSCI